MTTSTDPIADMLTRVRNANAVNKETVSMPHSKVKEAVAKLLADNGFVTKIEVKNSPSEIGKILTITLSSQTANNPITEIERLSRPGRRTYAKVNQIPVVKRGRGIVIVSTSKGVMTGDDAKKAGIGGELICRVY